MHKLKLRRPVDLGRVRRLWQGLSLFLWVLPSLKVAAASTSTPSELKECQLPAGDWAQCLHVEVPENRRNPEARKLTLQVVVMKALAPKKDAEPIYLLAGGPGQSASEGFMPLPETFRRLRRTHDLVLIDQRGTGQSHPLRCVDPKDSRWQLTFDENLSLRNVEACVQRMRLNTDLTAFTTDAAAEDMEAVRLALGHEKIILVGVSYGTRLALRYGALYPNAVARQILEGVISPDVNLFREDQALTDSLQSLAALCRKDVDCQAYGDPWVHYQTLQQSWRRLPKVSVKDPRSGQLREVVLRPGLLDGFVRSLLYAPVDMSILPAILQAAVGGDLGPLMAKALGSDFGVYDGLYLLLTCAEDFRDMGPPLSSFQSSIAEQCRLLPQVSLPADFRKQPVSQVPSLFLSGGLDPVTPPRYADRLKASLPQNTHVILPDYGHNISYVSCVQDLMMNFVDSKKPTIELPSCLKDLRALHFVKGAKLP